MDYKKEIAELLDQVDDKELLAYLYGLVKEIIKIEVEA